MEKESMEQIGFRKLISNKIDIGGYFSGGINESKATIVFPVKDAISDASRHTYQQHLLRQSNAYLSSNPQNRQIVVAKKEKR